MPKEVYLNMTELAQLLTGKAKLFTDPDETNDARAFFDFELKNQGKQDNSINTPYGRFNDRVKGSKLLSRVVSEMKYAKSKPDSVMAKRFLRDLYQIIYYMLGDEKSGFKPESISNPTVIDKVNLMRMKNTKSLTEKLRLALDNNSINFFQFREITEQFATALHNGKTRAYDKKLVDLIENKLVKLASLEIKNVDLSPDNMKNQSDDLKNISSRMVYTIHKLYPDESVHKSELIQEWDESHVMDRAFSAVQNPDVYPVETENTTTQPKQETASPVTEKQKVGLFKRAAIKLKNKWFKQNVQNLTQENEK